jgi:GDPmannose 4,6-dehydratase
MWLMLQQSEPSDYVIATGETHSVREFAELAFKHLGLDYRQYVTMDSKFFRPAEIESLQGDSSYALKVLGWKYSLTFEQLVKELVDADMHIQAGLQQRAFA